MFSVTKLVEKTEKISLNPKSKLVMELIDSSSVKTLRDGTEVLMFRSKKGAEKGDLQITKRVKTSIPKYANERSESTRN